MKKSVAILAALLAASLFSFSSQAEEKEIKSTGGASLGKWKYDEIDPTDALLEVGLDGRRLVSVSAGYIGNNSYREIWRFDNSRMVYSKLPTGHFYIGGAFNERDAPGFFCGADVEKNCDVLESEKLSRNLIVVKYRHRASGAACAGLEYMDEENFNEGYGASFGDYYVLVSTCAPAKDDHEEALALSAHYLSLVKKDGRPIARLSRYDLPKPSERAIAPRPSPTPRVIAKHAVEPGATNARVCTMSTGYGDWLTSRSFQDWVEEAHKRNLSLEDCETLLTAKQRRQDSAYGRETATRVCNMAVENGAWQKQKSLQEWVDEARKRGFTPEKCEKFLGVRSSAFGRAPDNSVCNMATQDGDWVTSSAFHKWIAEAHRRNLSLDDCEKLL